MTFRRRFSILLDADPGEKKTGDSRRTEQKKKPFFQLSSHHQSIAQIEAQLARGGSGNALSGDNGLQGW